MAFDDSDMSLKRRSSTFCLMLGASALWILALTMLTVYGQMVRMELNLLSQSHVWYLHLSCNTVWRMAFQESSHALNSGVMGFFLKVSVLYLFQMLFPFLVFPSQVLHPSPCCFKRVLPTHPHTPASPL